MVQEILQLENYGLESGFISGNLPPLRHLEADYFSSWEDLMKKFHGLLRARRLREAVLKVRSYGPKK
jgi:hypothetical protein